MRKGLIWAVLAMAAGILMPAKPRSGKSRLEAPEPRRAGSLASATAFAAPQTLAKLSSLWIDRAGSQCRVPTLWGETGEPSAAFAPILRLRLRAARQALAASTAAAWTMQEEVALMAANDAEIASRLVMLQPGQSAVRLVKAASFRPRRAMMGEREAQLAA